MRHVNLATGLGSRVLRAAVPHAHIGTTNYVSPAIGSGPGSLAGVAERAADAVLNRAFLEPLLGLGYPWRGAAILLGVHRWIRDGDDADVVADLDFLGVHCTTRAAAPFLPIPRAVDLPPVRRRRARERADLPRLGDHPREGSAWCSTRFARTAPSTGSSSPRVGRPLHRRGGPTSRVHDARRIAYYRSHLAQVAAATDGGGPRSTATSPGRCSTRAMRPKGWEPRLGLVHVDYDTQVRTIKDSGYWFADQLGGSARP